MKSAAFSFPTVALLLSTFASAISIDCDHVRVKQKSFDLSKLKGPHSVTFHDENRPPSVYNTTYTVDICAPLRKLKEVPNADQCPAGTHVCGVVKSWNPTDDPDQEHVQLENVIPIAGNFETSSGKSLDPVFTRLKETDSEQEGLQLEMHGGVYAKRNQKAVIQFVCDRKRTGNEGSEEATDRKSLKAREEEIDKDESERSLTFISYGGIGGKDDMDVLKLNWRTKYACEDTENDDDDDDRDDDNEVGKNKAGWGFFTWFILILFLSIAAYLIFGSWLNYNRYGARGWDLLPHGDTIRDMPYLFKDWSKKVVDTVQGGGSRGGYSAV